MTDDDIRALFDMASSYIHISDYPEDEEVDTLRRIATQLGVEPEKVTPYGHAHRFPHLAKPDGWVRVRDELRPRNCAHCFKPSDDPPHTGVEGERRIANEVQL